MCAFRYRTAIYTLQQFNAIKNDYFQNAAIDVQKPHQAEVFCIATALHSTAQPRILTQRSMRQMFRHDLCDTRATQPADSHRNEQTGATQANDFVYSSDMVLYSTMQRIADVQPALNAHHLCL